MRLLVDEKYYTSVKTKKIILTVTAFISILSFYNTINANNHTIPIEKHVENFNIELEQNARINEQSIQYRPELIQVFEVKKKEFKPLNHQELDNLDLRQPSNLSVEQAEDIVKNTGFKGLGATFVKADELYGINALYLISHAAWESAWGQSKLAKTKNNLFGFTAYDGTPNTSAKKFSTKEECILFVAKYIKEQYLTEDGLYYNGPTLKAMNIKYASDKKWAEGITEVIAYLQDKVA